MFAAYTRLTVFNHARNVQAGREPIKSSGPNTAGIRFYEFIDSVKESKAVSEDLARSSPQSEVVQSDINARHNHNYEFERLTLGIIEEAYELGLVGQDGELVSVQSQPSETTAEESVWSTLGRQVNVHAATQEEMAAVSQRLYDTGNISLKVHATMSFDPSRIPRGNDYRTRVDEAGRVDWVAEFVERLQLARSRNDSNTAEILQDVLHVLDKLDKVGPDRAESLAPASLERN